MLVGGVEEDGSVRLFLTEPYGLYFEYKAAVIGEGEAEIDAYLQKKYKPNMSVEEGIKFGLVAMKEFLGSEFNFERVDVVYVNTQDKRWTKLTDGELKNFVK